MKAQKDKSCKPQKRRMKQSKVNKLRKDPSKIRIRIVPEHLRSSPYPEAKTPLELEYDITRNKWTVLNKDEYISTILQKQAAYMTDQQMAEFWGKSARMIKDLRQKYGLTKYNKKGKATDSSSSQQGS
jgi:replication-associated recombination protein RarA